MTIELASNYIFSKTVYLLFSILMLLVDVVGYCRCFRCFVIGLTFIPLTTAYRKCKNWVLCLEFADKILFVLFYNGDFCNKLTKKLESVCF